MNTAQIQRSSTLPASAYRSTYLRAARAEIGKAAQSTGFWVTSAIATLLSGGIMLVFVMLSPEIREYDPFLIASMWDTFGMFLIPLAVLMVTAEYSHNTMRTTVLAVPNRAVAFAAKMTAVLVMCGGAALAIVASQFAVFQIAARPDSMANHSLRSLVMMWVVLTALSLGASGLAYMLRSTAGAITLLVVVLEFASLLTIIPNETLQKYLQMFLPNLVGLAAVNTGSRAQLMFSGYSDLLDWPVAAGVWLAYMAALVVGGFFRYTRTDI